MTNKRTQINRDPFSRASLMREKTGKHEPCKWCGQMGDYFYGWESDSIGSRPANMDGPFCSVSCYRTYTS